jgi:3',5'-cyclic AMP phosphodiesterase CpdA
MYNHDTTAPQNAAPQQNYSPPSRTEEGDSSDASILSAPAAEMKFWILPDGQSESSIAPFSSPIVQRMLDTGKTCRIMSEDQTSGWKEPAEFGFVSSRVAKGGACEPGGSPEDESASGAPGQHRAGFAGAEPEAQTTVGSEIDEPGRILSSSMSIYKNVKRKESDEVITLSDFLSGNRDGRWENEVERVRGILNREGEDAYREAKKELPAVTISGVVRGRRLSATAQNRMDHNGLLQVDLDGKDHPDKPIAAMLEILKCDPHVFAAWISTSGKGVKAIVRIPADCSSHKSTFATAERHLAGKGLKMDGGTDDAGRLCLVSHDSDLWINQKPVLPFKPEETLDAPASSASAGYRKPSRDEIRAKLKVIPPRPDYLDWLKIGSAVFSVCDEETGVALLKEWSPEEKVGEYVALYRNRLSQIGFGTLFWYARKNGYKMPGSVQDDLPADALPAPKSGVGFEQSATAIFSTIGPSMRLYNQGGSLCEIDHSRQGQAKFRPVSAERLCALAETFGKRIVVRKRRSKSDGGGHCWDETTLNIPDARVLMKSDAASEFLPPIQSIVGCPVLVGDGGTGYKILGSGYHLYNGGVWVDGGTIPEVVPVHEARASLIGLLEDFQFATPADCSRAIAMLISPCMRFGCLIDDDFPVDVSEADQSQSGKSLRLQLVGALYNEHATVITANAGGVGSLDESLAQGMIDGRPFICFDNWRGKFNSRLFESAVRGQGRVNCRALRNSQTVETSGFIWQISTNGAELTKDLANRSIITRIRKQPEGYRFKTYPEGGVIKHIRARQGYYLGCVFSVVSLWLNAGKPKSNECRHDFQQWCQAMDWIVQKIFSLPPVLDGHDGQLARVSSPHLGWMRSLAIAVSGANRAETWLAAADLQEVMVEAGLDAPGAETSGEDPVLRLGRVLGTIFGGGTEKVEVDGWVVDRRKDTVYDPGQRKNRHRYSYSFCKSRLTPEMAA